MDQKEKQIEITLIIPTYNSASFIQRTIKSAKKFLTNYEFEILVIDDGSTDQIRDKVAKVSNYHVRFLPQSHQGVSYSRNIGIEEAKGQYVMFCDADDQLNGILPPMTFNEDIISFSKNCRVNSVFKSLAEKITLIESLFGFNASSPSFPAVYGGSVSKLFKLSFLRSQSIYFDTKLTNSEDILFNMKAILKAISIRTVSQGIYVYYQRQSSVTHSFDKNLQINHQYFVSQVKHLLTQLPNSSVLIGQIESLYMYQLVFRYWLYIDRPSAHYSQWSEEIRAGNSSRWNENLNRAVEKITIYLVNKFGITVALKFAQLYVLLKRLMPKKMQPTNVIL